MPTAVAGLRGSGPDQDQIEAGMGRRGVGRGQRVKRKKAHGENVELQKMAAVNIKTGARSCVVDDGHNEKNSRRMLKVLYCQLYKRDPNYQVPHHPARIKLGFQSNAKFPTSSSVFPNRTFFLVVGN